MDRDNTGKFTQGNKAAMGRSKKHAEKMANLRATLFEVVTPDRLHRIINALIVEAESGNVQAARLILSYSLGEPLQADVLERIEALEQEAA